MNAINDKKTLETTVRDAVKNVKITDIHTHLFPSSHGSLLLWNVNELLTYHYLVAETFTVAPMDLTYDKFWAMNKTQQADLIWDTLFIKRGPISEACRGVLTCLNSLGLDVANRDLASIRKWFAEQKVENYIDKVFELAGLDEAIMTNDPFVAEEVKHWNAGKPGHPLFKTALRIDPLIVNWKQAAATMKAQGYDTEALNEKSFTEARRFLKEWAKKLNPVYMAASLPPHFAYPANDEMATVVKNIILPFAKETGLPVAMMIGVRKKVNPALGDGGDGVGVADVTAVQHLCMENPDVKFLVTMLSRVNQHELCILARKCRNLHLFGCWWFCNNPSIIDEMTRQRVELLGTSTTLQHSDARVLDQLIYKWTHSRRIIADVLVDKYNDQFDAGWRTTPQEIARDARHLLGGSFWEFIAK